MLDDAAYYSQREKDERALAELSSDNNVRNIHLLLADKYSQLARLELAKLCPDEHASGPSVSVKKTARIRRSDPLYR